MIDSAKKQAFKVDFFLLGAQKAATTTLAHHFQHHPDISFSRKKEPNFFNWKAASELAWYQNLFEAHKQLRGEGSVDYSYRSYFLGTHQKIFEHNPNAKFIFILRHPIERLISHYTFNKMRGLLNHDFILWELESKWEYLQRSRYYSELKPYLDTFPKKQFLFLHFEEFIRSPQLVFNECCEFLGIAHYKVNEKSIQNKSKDKLSAVSIQQQKSVTGQLFKYLKKFIPSKAKILLKKKVYAPITRPELPDDVVTYIYSLLHQDIQNIQKYTGTNLDWRYTYNGKTYIIQFVK